MNLPKSIKRKNLISLGLILFVLSVLSTFKQTYAATSEQNKTVFGDLVQEVKEFVDVLIHGELTVRGKAHFLSPIAAESAHILGDFSQGGTLFITEGGKIENLAGNLQLQGSEKGGVVFG